MCIYIYVYIYMYIYIYMYNAGFPGGFPREKPHKKGAFADTSALFWGSCIPFAMAMLLLGIVRLVIQDPFQVDAHPC